MQLKPNLPKLLSSFIFPDDANIDVLESAKALSKIESYRANVKSMLMTIKFNQYKSILEQDNGVESIKKLMDEYEKTLTEDFITEQIVSTSSSTSVYNCYVSLKYDEDILQGSPVIFDFNTINISDLDILADKFSKLEGLLEAIKSSKHDNKADEILTNLVKNKEARPLVKELVKTILEAKVVKVRNIDLSREQVINILTEDENLTPTNLQALFSFLKSLYENNVKKKKSS